MSQPVLVEVRRGYIVESRHRGSIVAVEPDGRVIARVGDEYTISSTRSAIKPIQAIPVITSGAADRFELSPREIALICGSHSGEPMHTEAVQALLTRIGLGERALLCGAHRPYSEQAAKNLELSGRPFSQLHSNCSGKHVGMIATAVHLGIALDDYVSPSHPIQRAITSLLKRIGGIEDEPPIAIDGCSAPTFAVSIASLALSFARLVDSLSEEIDAANPLDERERAAARRIIGAMTSHPEMVAGSAGRLDTDLMRATAGRLICKIGAEAVYAIGVLPCERFPRGLGVAMKIEDGASRGLNPTVVETLVQLEVLGCEQSKELAAYHSEKIINFRGLEAGEVRAIFNLGFTG